MRTILFILILFHFISAISLAEEFFEKDSSSYNKDELKILLEAYLGGENLKNKSSFITSLNDYKNKMREENRKKEEDEAIELLKFSNDIKEAIEKILAYESLEKSNSTINNKNDANSQLKGRERLLRAIK